MGRRTDELLEMSIRADRARVDRWTESERRRCPQCVALWAQDGRQGVYDRLVWCPICLDPSVPARYGREMAAGRDGR